MRVSSSLFTCSLGLLLAVWATLSCATAVPVPGAAQLRQARERWPELSQEELVEGRDLYVSRCSGCHNLRRPGEKPVAYWEHWMTEMSSKGQLPPEEASKVLRYLVGAAKAPEPRATPPGGAGE